MLNLKEENKAIQEKIKTMDFSEIQEHYLFKRTKTVIKNIFRHIKTYRKVGGRCIKR